MKKVFLVILMGVMVTSCTENERVKAWGGEGTIKLPKGRKLVNVTWKETQIWYLTRQMDSNDVVGARVGVVCAIRESASNPTGKKVGMAAERDSGNE